MVDRQDLQVGDETVVVITDPNEGQDRDAMTQIDGIATFVRFKGDYSPDFGETVRVRIADVKETTIVAVAIERGDPA